MPGMRFSAFRAFTSADQRTIGVGSRLAGAGGGMQGGVVGGAERPQHTRLAPTGGETNLRARLLEKTVLGLMKKQSLPSCLPAFLP